MQETNLFETATRLHYRFATRRGNLTVEDIWELSMEDLDALYRQYVSEIRDDSEDSLIKSVVNSGTVELTHKRDIIAHIFNAKQTLKDEAKKRTEQRLMKSRIRELIYEKQNAALAEKSEAELKKLLEELDV